MTKKDVISWFELYVTDFDRAKRFYETILKAQLQEMKCEGRMGMSPYDDTKGVGGCIVQMAGGSPGAGGALVYLNVEGDLDGVIQRITAAGGSILEARMSIGEPGFIAMFKDTEGNVVGLHSCS